MSFIRRTQFIALLGAAALVGGCATAPEPAPAPTGPVISEAARGQFARALWAIEAGREEEARALLRALSDQEPQLAGPAINLGLLEFKAGNLDAAEAALTRAIAADPERASTYNQLGIVHRQQGRFAQARDVYLQALRLDPDYASAHLNLGILYEVYLGDLGQALQHYERYQSLNGAEDAEVGKWVVDLQRRQASARAEPRG